MDCRFHFYTSLWNFFIEGYNTAGVRHVIRFDRCCPLRKSWRGEKKKSQIPAWHLKMSGSDSFNSWRWCNSVKVINNHRGSAQSEAINSRFTCVNCGLTGKAVLPNQDFFKCQMTHSQRRIELRSLLRRMLGSLEKPGVHKHFLLLI